MRRNVLGIEVDECNSFIRPRGRRHPAKRLVRSASNEKGIETETRGRGKSTAAPLTASSTRWNRSSLHPEFEKVRTEDNKGEKEGRTRSRDGPVRMLVTADFISSWSERRIQEQRNHASQPCGSGAGSTVSLSHAQGRETHGEEPVFRDHFRIQN